MARAGRVIEIILGVFFIASAASKVVNIDGFAVQISLYGVVKDPDLVRLAAYVTIALEALLGAAFIAAWRFKGASFGVAGGLTLVFSGLILYAWQVKGLEDCGCFGDFLKMTPPQSLLKNVLLVAVVGTGWYGACFITESEGKPKPRSSVPIAIAILSLTLVAGLGLLFNDDSATESGIVAQSVKGTDESRPFAKFQFVYDDTPYKLGEGEYLIVLLNATCGHCIASVPELNELASDPELPEMVALMMADSGEEIEQMEAFRRDTNPAFPTQLIDMLEFVEFLDVAPPRLMYVKDGREIAGWEWDDEAPSAAEVAGTINS